jgi:hypothetical protein
MRSHDSASESRWDPASTWIGKAERATMSAGSGSRVGLSGAAALGGSGERAGAWAGSAAQAADASDPRPIQKSRRAALGVSLKQRRSIDVGYQLAGRRANWTVCTVERDGGGPDELAARASWTAARAGKLRSSCSATLEQGKNATADHFGRREMIDHPTTRDAMSGGGRQRH